MNRPDRRHSGPSFPSSTNRRRSVDERRDDAAGAAVAPAVGACSARAVAAAVAGDAGVGGTACGVAAGAVDVGALLRRATRGEAETDDERAGALEQRAARNCVRHHGCRLPSHCGFPAARAMARRMRRCVPQRQRLRASAVRACASVGCGFCWRSAAPVMIMPEMQ